MLTHTKKILNHKHQTRCSCLKGIRPKTADFLNHIPRIYFAVKKSHV
mgnify:CR=1 FL=1